MTPRLTWALTKVGDRRATSSNTFTAPATSPAAYSAVPRRWPSAGSSGPELERSAEGCHRSCRVSVPERANPVRLVHRRALQQVGGRPQRIGQRRPGTTPAAKVRLGFLALAHRPIRHGERIVDRRRSLLERQGALEVLHGLRIRLLRQSRTACAEVGRRRARSYREGFLEHLPGRVRTAVIQDRFAEPYERGQICRPQFERPLERRAGLRAIALQQVHVPETVGPTHLGWRQAPVRGGSRLRPHRCTSPQTADRPGGRRLRLAPLATSPGLRSFARRIDARRAPALVPAPTTATGRASRAGADPLAQGPRYHRSVARTAGQMAPRSLRRARTRRAPHTQGDGRSSPNRASAAFL